MKHNFGCHSYFDSVEGEKQENLRQLYLLFLF